MSGRSVGALLLGEPVERVEPVEPVEARLEGLARAGGPLRRALAALAGKFVARRAHEPLGYARLGDYARERLGLSGRLVQELAQIDTKLGKLPQLEAALVAGRLPWSKVRLIARFATALDEARWIARARESSVRVLERELRAVARGAVGTVEPMEEEAEPDEAVESVVVSMPLSVAFKWRRTCRYAAQVAGESTPPAEVLEWATAEVLAGLPGTLVEVGGFDAARGGGEESVVGAAEHDPVRGVPAANVCAAHGAGAVGVAAANVCATHGAGADGAALGETSCELPAFVAPLLEGLEELDAFELDARLRRAVRLEQRREAEIAPLLRAVTAPEYEWQSVHHSLGTYAREHLGMSPRKARALLRLERVGDVCPELRVAFRNGALSWVQAQLLARLVVGGEAENVGLSQWVAWVTTVSVRKLEETVGRAVLLREADPRGEWADPERIAAADEEPLDELDPLKRKTCAHSTDRGENLRLRITAPREVARLFSRTLCSVRLAMERETGRLPTEGDAFEAMLDRALQAWQVEDLWLRQRSRRNLQRHHIRFRSAGGSDAPENQTTLCAFHHLRGVHVGRVRVSGRAPDELCFELGTRSGGPPLVRYRSGDRCIGAGSIGH